jgi:hypothetical protein
MIRIAISVEAFEAIARTLPLGNLSFENKTDERGERFVWLAPAPPPAPAPAPAIAPLQPNPAGGRFFRHTQGRSGG